MQIVETISEARASVAVARVAGQSVGLVPPMGALHPGHLSLIAAARGRDAFVVVSIFVNPTQFDPGDDYDRYPRNLACDAELAEQERGHQKRFEQMLADLGEYKAPDSYADEYLTYVHALTSQRAFPDEQAAQRAADECADDVSAVELAIGFERDTLILMGEMRGMVPEKDRPIVDQLIDEERSHLVVLTAARGKLTG